MTVLGWICVAAAVVSAFAGKAVIAAAVAHIQQAHPREYQRLSHHGALFKGAQGAQGSVDRARRGIAGPLLTGALPPPLRTDPAMRKAKDLWRAAFAGMIGFFALALAFLSRGG